MKSCVAPKDTMSLPVRTASGKSNSWRAREAWTGCSPRWLAPGQRLPPKAPAHAFGFAPTRIVVSFSTTIRAHAAGVGVPWPFAATAAKWLPLHASMHPRAQKKSEKPPKVITDETLDVKKGDVQSATAEQLRIPGTPETQAQSTPANAPSSAVQSEKKASEDEKLAKELAALKEQIKQAQGDLELLQREQSLEQDNHYSKTDYAQDTAGKKKPNNP